jgi:regulator of sigma E protease
MLDEREGAVATADRPGAFNLKPLWQRAAVVAAGPAANLLLAWFLYSLVHWMGADEPKARLSTPAQASVFDRAGVQAGDVVQAYSVDRVDWQAVRSMNDLRWQVTQALLSGQPLYLTLSDAAGQAKRQVLLELDTLGAKDMNAEVARRIGVPAPFSEPRLGEISVGGAAQRAGLQAGDLVRSVGDVWVKDSEQLRALIRSRINTTEPMAWVVERAGQRLNVAVTPITVVAGDQSFGRIEAVIHQPAEMVRVSYGLLEGVSHSAVRVWELSSLTLKMLGRMITGQASVKNLSGPITMADYAGQSARLGLATYLSFLAVISISLGVLNLLPLPMLDGGHLMYYLFEALTGRALSTVWFERLQRVGLALMLMLMSLAFYNDVARYWLLQ